MFETTNQLEANGWTHGGYMTYLRLNGNYKPTEKTFSGFFLWHHGLLKQDLIGDAYVCQPRFEIWGYSASVFRYVG